MKLGTKINLVLATVVAVTLTIAFWVIISIEGANLKQQAVNDAATVTDVLRLDVERMFNQINGQQRSSGATIIHTEDISVLQDIADSVGSSGLISSLVVFNRKLEVVAITGGEKNELANDSANYKQLREDTLAGKNSIGEAERVYNGKEIIMRVVPIVSKDMNTGAIINIGLIEVHILKSSYESRIGELKIRMFAVGIIFTAILIIVLAVILEREVVGPLRRYSVVAKKISDGDLSQKVEYHSNDEIGEFGAVFNTMVANLHELDKMKSDFISVAAHQLRTPLSGVRWVLKLLLDGDLGAISDDQKGMVERGYENSERMSQLVDDLLNVSRMENGKLGYKIEKNSFMSLLSTLVENTELQAKERNVKVVLENHAGEISDFSFDKEKLLTAFQNIVDNAMKYTMPGGKVTISVDKKGDYLEVKVADTGVGIPKDEIPKLFSKFFRAANVVHLQTEGSGLGLFIVKNIIIRHGGQIWVESEEGRGTTITIKIPVIDELLPTSEIANA